VHQPRHHEDYLYINDKSDSTSDSDTNSLFDSSVDEAGTASDTDINNPLKEVNNNTNGDGLFDDEA
jgi:hypothetical protein